MTSTVAFAGNNELALHFPSPQGILFDVVEKAPSEGSCLPREDHCALEKTLPGCHPSANSGRYKPGASGDCILYSVRRASQDQPMSSKYPALSLAALILLAAAPHLEAAGINFLF